MFRFLKGKWVSEEEYREQLDCIKSAKLENYRLSDEHRSKEIELLNIIEEKEKMIQGLKLEILKNEEDLLRVSRNFWEKNDELINFANKTGETIEGLKLEIERLKGE